MAEQAETLRAEMRQALAEATTALRREMHELYDGLAREVQALRAETDRRYAELSQELQALRDAMRSEVRTLRADLAALGREVSNLREGMADMERRLMEAIRHRREDEDLAFR